MNSKVEWSNGTDKSATWAKCWILSSASKSVERGQADSLSRELKCQQYRTSSREVNGRCCGQKLKLRVLLLGCATPEAAPRSLGWASCGVCCRWSHCWQPSWAMYGCSPANRSAYPTVTSPPASPSRSASGECAQPCVEPTSLSVSTLLDTELTPLSKYFLKT